MARYHDAHGELIEDTPIWDQQGDGKAHTRRCGECKALMNVIGARPGKLYYCPTCETARAKVYDWDGDGAPHARRCIECRELVTVIGAQVGRGYLCPTCAAQRTTVESQ